MKILIIGSGGREHALGWKLKQSPLVTEIIASSPKSFDDAVKVGIQRGDKTLKNVKGAWVRDQKVVVSGGKISEYRVIMKVTFVLKA